MLQAGNSFTIKLAAKKDVGVDMSQPVKELGKDKIFSVKIIYKIKQDRFTCM